MVTAELRVMIIVDRCNEQVPVRLNAPGPERLFIEMVSLPYELFRHILSFRDPIYEYARRFGTPSAQWAEEYIILTPGAEYEMINGRIVTLYWDRPYISIHSWACDMILMPARASF